MTLVSTKKLLEDAYQNHYAIGAFATHNLETMKAVVEAADELQVPVIFQTTPGTIKYVGIKYMVAMAEAASDQSRVPIALHLDHGDSFEMVVQCIRHGYTSIMIDGSKLPYEENIALVKRVADVAHSVGVPVEAELGTIGGVEDDLSVDEAEATYTDPYLALDFVKRTQIDSLAPAFGTAHGIYKGEPKLDLKRLKKISDKVGIPLVMHGASGVPKEQVVKAIACGASKVNISTELKIPFAETLREYLNENPKESDPRKLFVSARVAVKEVVKEKIMMLNENKIASVE